MSSHTVTIDWMGEPTTTVAELVPADPIAMCIGINPALVSVAAGHYYQGQLGQKFFARLRQAGVLQPSNRHRFDDDVALESGIGFSDIVKRATVSADEIAPAEFTYGAARLREQLDVWCPPVIVFSFKKTAVQLLGRFDGNGWLTKQLSGADLFVMPGPYEARGTVSATLASLADRWPTR